MMITDACAISWPRWSTTMRVVTLDPRYVDEAREIVDAVLDDVELAASRFRPDAEIFDLAAAGGAPVRVSAILFELVSVALAAAAQTNGAVDPTLGNDLIDLGYDRSITDLTRPQGDSDGDVDGESGVMAAGNVPSVVVSVVPSQVWKRIHLDAAARTISVPPGVLLDLGATAKAWAADRAAALVELELGTSVLVSLGGDIATAGPGPVGGWQILVRDRDDDPGAQVSLPGGLALATSSTQARRWLAEGREHHHVLDPVRRAPVPACWRSVSVVASSCVSANVFSTYAIVAGPSAPARLRLAGMEARLLGVDRELRYVGGWPRAAELASA